MLGPELSVCSCGGAATGFVATLSSPFFGFPLPFDGTLSTGGLAVVAAVALASPLLTFIGAFGLSSWLVSTLIFESLALAFALAAAFRALFALFFFADGLGIDSVSLFLSTLSTDSVAPPSDFKSYIKQDQITCVYH